MEYFALLTVATVVVAILTFALYRKRRDWGLVAGFAALYYWTFYGAWFVVIDKTGGFSGQRYHYLEIKMFPVDLDGDYLLALCLYSGFLIAIQLTMLIVVSRPLATPLPRLVLRHEPVLIMGFLAAAGSMLLIGGKLTTAYALNTSAYMYTRFQTDQWFTLHQVLNRVALLPSAIGMAQLAAGDRSRFFVSVRRRYTLPCYLALFAVMGGFTFVLGNKNEVLMALLTGVLVYTASVRRPRYWKLALVVTAGFWFLYTIDFFRGVPLGGMQDAVLARIDETSDVGRFVTSSNEAYAAHFSLYGVLAARVQPLFGYSLYSLACSVIPRIFWPGRPGDIYDYYSQSVGAVGGQGYSIHHATGWYLNFGIPGVALGGVALGLAWAYCLNAGRRLRPDSGLLLRLFTVVAPSVFAACLPPLVRTGPEGYKGLILEGIIIPVGTLVFACRPARSAQKLNAQQLKGGSAYAAFCLRYYSLPK